MIIEKRISSLYKKSEVVPFDDKDRIVLISDMHRSNGSNSDQFLQNQNTTLAALRYYFNNGYTYIELGDGDELWVNKSMEVIKTSHFPIFSMLKKFHNGGRLKMLYGNHDMEKKKSFWAEENLKDYPSECFYCNRIELFGGLQILESLVLRYTPADQDILLLHGHQADFFNYDLWRLSKFLVRRLWQPLELIGVKDPTSASASYTKTSDIDLRLSNWSKKRNHMLVAGHTHRAVFPEPGEAPYFNDGCCVHPYYITAVEIIDGMISLVRWKIKAAETGALFVGRDVIKGPVHITAFV